MPVSIQVSAGGVFYDPFYSTKGSGYQDDFTFFRELHFPKPRDSTYLTKAAAPALQESSSVSLLDFEESESNYALHMPWADKVEVTYRLEAEDKVGSRVLLIEGSITPEEYELCRLGAGYTGSKLQRRLSLPVDADYDNLALTAGQGILTIVLPKVSKGGLENAALK